MDKGKRNNEKEIETMWKELKQIVFNNVVEQENQKEEKMHKIQGLVGY